MTRTPCIDLSDPEVNRYAAKHSCEREIPPSGPQVSRAEFAELIEQHQAKLCGFLRRYTRNREDAEDIAQDTFVKAYRNLHRYDPKYRFSTWLYTIARRTAYNHLRDQRVGEPLNYDIAATAESPDAEAAREDERSRLWQAVEGLKPTFREAVTLKYAEDLSVEEIAVVMQKSQTNVKIILFRARNQLKRLCPKERKGPAA